MKLLDFNYFALIFIQTINVIDGGRWGWNGNNHHYNTGGHNGGGNGWRVSNHRVTQQQNHGTKIIRVPLQGHGGNGDVIRLRPNPNSNNVWDVIADPYVNFDRHEPEPDSGVEPSVEVDTSAQESSCVIPSMGDMSKFELKCLTDSTEGEQDCNWMMRMRKLLPSGTTIMLKCKAPFTSENGEMRLWTCDDGIWKGEFKSIKCVGSAIITEEVEVPPAKPYLPWFQGHHLKANESEKSQQQQNYHASYDVDKPKKNPFPTYPLKPNTPNEYKRPRPNPNPSRDPNTQVWHNIPPETHSTDQDDLAIIDEFLEGLTANEGTHPVQPQPTVKRPFEDYTGWQTTSTTTTPVPWVPTTTTVPTTTSTTTQSTTTQSTTTKAPDLFSNWNLDSGPKCPPLSKRTGVQLKCISKIKVPLPWAPSSFVVTEDECETPQQVGSEATYQCEKYYEATSALKTLYRKCKDDGTWSGNAEIFSCTLECGVSNPVGQVPLITHGEPTYKAQWPWHAALFFKSRAIESTRHFDYNCGGTLINRRTVLTAAHCMTLGRSTSLRNISMFRIDLGRYERVVDDEYVQSFSVEQIIVHPDYNPNSYDSDIAMIILKSAVSIGYHVRPICYPQQQNTAFEDLHLASGSVGTVVGFGKNENNVEADILHMAKLRVITSKECAISFADTSFGSALAKSTTFCAGLQNGTNVCSGDSGGGIYFPVASIQGSRWYLMGLVSVGVQTDDKKCDPTRYSVFTKIGPYADWIGRVLSTQDYSDFY